MGLSSWIRRSPLVASVREPLGIDFNASRARAAHGKPGRNKLYLLNEPDPDLPLAISLEHRTPQVGHAALLTCRKLPHTICSAYLSHLGDAHEWKSGRNTLNAETALGLALERLRSATHGHEGLAFALPGYLTFTQVTKFISLVDTTKMRILGTASIPLALAVERATHFLHGEMPDPKRHSRSIAPTSVLIVDVDDHAMTAAVVRLSEQEVRSISAVTLPRLGLRFWRERLLDSLSDRCVRQCRRDPRDNADAEQMLFDQLESAIERARTGQRIAITIRASHWFQDLLLSPVDLDGFCANLCRQAADEVRSLVASANEPEPPQAVWLTHDAGRLPGLAAALHQNMAERTNVRVLHPEAAAAAVANLIDRWGSGELPRTHLDTMIPLPKGTASSPVAHRGIPSAPVRGGG